MQNARRNDVLKMPENLQNCLLDLCFQTKLNCWAVITIAGLGVNVVVMKFVAEI